MGVNDGTSPASAFPHHRPVARSNGVGRVPAQMRESREPSSRQGDHSRECALYPVVHSTTKSARRLLWASLKGRQLLTSTLLFARWPFLQRHSCGIPSIGTGQETSIVKRDFEACHIWVWSSFAAWNTRYRRSLSLLLLRLLVGPEVVAGPGDRETFTRELRPHSNYIVHHIGQDFSLLSF